jgi:hypothetical protein
MMDDEDNASIITISSRRGGCLDEESVRPGVEEAPPSESGPPTFTTDGLNITLLYGGNRNAKYSLSSNLFQSSHHGGCISVYDSGNAYNRLFDLSNEKDGDRRIIIGGHPDPAGVNTFKELYLHQEHVYKHYDDHISLRKPWKLVEKGEEASPLLEIRSEEGKRLVHSILHPMDRDRQFQWYDRHGTVIAIEHRTVYSWALEHRTTLSQAMEQSRPDYDRMDEIKSFPTLEIVAELEEKMMALVIATWIAKVWQEVIALHPTTMPIKQGGYGDY